MTNTTAAMKRRIRTDQPLTNGEHFAMGRQEFWQGLRENMHYASICIMLGNGDMCNWIFIHVTNVFVLLTEAASWGRRFILQIIFRIKRIIKGGGASSTAEGAAFPPSSPLDQAMWQMCYCFVSSRLRGIWHASDGWWRADRLAAVITW